MKNFNNQPLSSTARTNANTKWSINIQEIVKRTQKNLERGTPNQSSSLTRTYEDRISEQNIAQKSIDEIVPSQ